MYQRTSSTLQRLTKHEESVLNTPESLGKWSVTQVLYHLCEVKGLALGHRKKKIQAGDSISERAFLDELKLNVYLMALGTEVRFIPHYS